MEMKKTARQDLQSWFNENTPDPEKWKYSEAATNQIMWVRDVLHLMFLNSIVSTDEMSWDEAKATLTVDGDHISKSVLLPVYRIDIKGHSFKIRGNFHNWAVRYSGTIKKTLPDWMGVKVIDGVYDCCFEGMETPEGFQSQFVVWSKYNLYSTLQWILNEAI